MSSITSLSVQQLRKAAALKEKIQSLENELNKLVGLTATFRRPRRQEEKFRMSAAAKARISAAAKARWANQSG